jgi:hypothetical protein
VVDDAGEATPDLVAAISADGGEVESVREYRPSFEEVFRALVEHGAQTPLEERAALDDQAPLAEQPPLEEPPASVEADDGPR